MRRSLLALHTVLLIFSLHLMPRLHQRNKLRATWCLLRATRNLMRVTSNLQHDACCPQQVACCAQLVARNKLRWCKRGITLLSAKVNDMEELRQRIQTAWGQRDQRVIDRSVQGWRIRILQACVKAKGGYFEETLQTDSGNVDFLMFTSSCCNV